TVGMYFYVCDRYAGRVQGLRALSFVAGMLLILMALVSPLDAAAGRLLSMHMLQHVFLTTLGPPLVLLGLPPVLIGAVLRHRGAPRGGLQVLQPGAAPLGPVAAAGPADRRADHGGTGADRGVCGDYAPVFPLPRPGGRSGGRAAPAETRCMSTVPTTEPTMAPM